MSAVAYGVVVLFLIAGTALGWYANRAIASHGDVKVSKRRTKNYRKSRHRNGLITIILAFVIGVVVFNLLRPHPHP